MGCGGSKEEPISTQTDLKPQAHEPPPHTQEGGPKGTSRESFVEPENKDDNVSNKTVSGETDTEIDVTLGTGNSGKGQTIDGAYENPPIDDTANNAFLAKHGNQEQSNVETQRDVSDVTRTAINASDEQAETVNSQDRHTVTKQQEASEATVIEEALSTEKECEVKVTAEEAASTESNPEEATPNLTAMAAQERFNTALRFACSLADSDSVLQCASEDVRYLQLSRAPPPSLCLTQLLRKLPNIQGVNISNNSIGPQAFRAVMLSLCHNSSITSLNISNNMTDTDSAASVGRMLSSNQTLTFLDVSGNYLGLDFFSRSVAPAIATNNTLQTLRCESIGSTDLSSLAENLSQNTTLTHLNVAHNQLQDATTFMQHLVSWMEMPECPLLDLDVKNCGLKDEHIKTMAKAMRVNTSLITLSVAGNHVGPSNTLMDLIGRAISHPSLTSLTANDTKVDDPNPSWTLDIENGSVCSKMEVLSLTNCSLLDDLLVALSQGLGEGTMPHLKDLILTNNPGLTMNGLRAMVTLSTVSGELCGVSRLSWGLNPTDGLPNMLAAGATPKLQYLNLRRSKIGTASLALLLPRLQEETGISTLVLDGIKLAGSKVLKELLGAAASSSLNALSISSCSLADRDLSQLCSALKNGLPLHMLKLSANRITSKGVKEMVDALLSNQSHPLQLIDMSNNQIETDGASKLAELFTSSKHKTQIHSLNISNNLIGSNGLASLVSLLCNSPLVALHVHNQQVNYEEEDMDTITDATVKALGMTVQRNGDEIVLGSTALPELPPGLVIRLNGLGGNTGELGKLLDCAGIVTDFSVNRLPQLSLQHALELAAYFRGQDSSSCVMSQEDWNNVISAEKEAPTWLQLQESIDVALFISHLPASITVAKMEGILEMEADCGVQEVFLLKDPVTRNNNGFAWVLLSSIVSVDAAMEYFHRGNARVFGKSFVVSKVNVKVDDAASGQAVAKARQELEQRRATRAQEHTAHRDLIRQSYVESQERHAYRLAHPAYADGRIW